MVQNLSGNRNESEKEVEIKSMCPKCGKQIRLSVPYSKLREAEGGITTIPFEHGDPPHLVVLYVDVHGDVRGQVIYDNIIREKAETGFFHEILKAIGIDLISIIVYWVLVGKKIKISIEDEKINSLLKTFITNVLGSEIALSPSKDVVEIDISKPKHPGVNLEPIRNIFNKLDRLDSDSARLVWIKRELERYRSGLNELIKLMQTKDVIDKETLMDVLGESFDFLEILLLINILGEIGFDIYQKFDLKELKIKSFFEP